ncbi:MAG: Holliday junction branch migration DNA helicase RuvB [Bacteriovoracaceae bacterium]
MEENILDAQLKDEEITHENRLRPQNFEEYVGQKKIIENISLMVDSANMRKQAMDHTLLSGPPGLGKTSLAMIIAEKLDSNLHVISGPAIEKKGDLAALLTNLEPRDVLFIDEIHRLPITVEEILYSAMEDFRLDIMLGQGPSARTMQIDIRPFTLLGATTRSGLLSNPLRDRFIAHMHFDFYNPQELAQIISNNAAKIQLDISEDAKLKMATCSRGTPRIANRVLRRVRDYSLVNNKPQVGMEEVNSSLSLMEIDDNGLNRMDRKILEVIHEFYSGGPVGIDALCATLGEDKNNIEDVYEPFLLKEGFLIRTPRGRELGEKSRKIFGDELPLFR